MYVRMRIIKWQRQFLKKWAVLTVKRVNYLIPNLVLPAEEEKPIGVWGQRHKYYLKEYRKATYTMLLTSGKLNIYLADIDKQAEAMFSRLVKEMTERQGVTGQLKAADQMLWVGRINNIRNAVMEIVNSELIYA